MKVVRILLQFSALLMLCGGATAAPLNIGYSGDYPPLSYTRENQAEGIDFQLLMQITEKMGREAHYIKVPLHQLFEQLQSGKIDIASGGISITEQRAKKVLFTDPYMITGQMPIIRYKDASSFGSKKAVYKAGAKVGVIEGTTGELLAQDQLPDAKIKTYKSQKAVIKALRKKNIDFIIHDAPTGWRLSSRPETHDLLSTFVRLNREPLAFAVHKDNTALAAQINLHLNSMIDSGTVDNIVEEWLPLQIEID